MHLKIKRLPYKAMSDFPQLVYIKKQLWEGLRERQRDKARRREL